MKLATIGGSKKMTYGCTRHVASVRRCPARQPGLATRQPGDQATRILPTPFASWTEGQIDQSKQVTGGQTGGGRWSRAGQEREDVRLCLKVILACVVS